MNANDERSIAEQRHDARCAVVTGAASGIGQAIAARLLADGWRVIGLDKVQAEQSSMPPGSCAQRRWAH
jgi:NAD(P)-dependent dehydrogenase (short-subunit alcohol dehydrogenase family)